MASSSTANATTTTTVLDKTTAPSQKPVKLKRKSKANTHDQQGLEYNNHSLQNLIQEYLSQWQLHQKDTTKPWRFQKKKQYLLLKHIFDRSLIDKKHFKIAVEYIKGLKGLSKDRLMEESTKIYDAYKVQKSESNSKELQDEESQRPSLSKENKSKGKRAKKILRAFSKS